MTVLQVRSFIDGAYQRTVALLKENKELVEKMAQVRPARVMSHTRVFVL
jgi:ATP-dependent Zn protease